MATSTNGIATVADCSNKGLTVSGYSNISECPKYSDFSCPSYTEHTVNISSTIKYVVTSGQLCNVSGITTTLSNPVPYGISVRYSAVDSSDNSKTVTVNIGAGSTSVTTSYPSNFYGVVYHSLSQTPEVYINGTTLDDSSETFYTRYVVNKSVTLV